VSKTATRLAKAGLLVLSELTAGGPQAA